jgi:hexosaminidase
MTDLLRAARRALIAALLVASGLVAMPVPQAAAAPATPTTVPALTGWSPAAGRYEPGSRVLVDAGQPSVHDDAETFLADAFALTGRRLTLVRSTADPRPGDIVVRLDPARSDLGAEGYAMTVGATVRITARTDAGAFYGTRTLLQLLRSPTVPAGSVVDVPQYGERGAGVCACMIHVSTAWFERLIKDAAYLKLNQLWVELKVKSTAHPEANEWGYYTPDQIARLQRLARKYHVTLVPEVNSPGHIGTWIRNRPDLQLTDDAGAKQVERLDITKPAAFEFLTDIIDEYLEVFDTPYWHMGADEYMLGSDYAKYPQMLAYAREKFGPDAVPEDAFVDFINRINSYVRAKGKTLRIWNDGITSRATVPLARDIVVEHWLGGGVKPSTLLGEGRRVMNAAYSLYNVRGGFKMNPARLYAEGWTPRVFEGETVATSNGITGAKITLWPDNGSGNTENEIEAEVRMPLRFVAQATWGSTSTPDPSYAGFEARAAAVGRAPGFENVDRTPVAAGNYTLTRGGRFLGPANLDDGATLGSGGFSAWRLGPTADGYYTLTNLTSGRCAEARLGTRYLNTPLEPGAPITLHACKPDNRLQRWQLALADGAVTLTNAVTRMVAVVDGSGKLVQQVPDRFRPTPFELTRAVGASAAVSVDDAGAMTLTATVANTTSRQLSGIRVRPILPSGWTAAPGDASVPSLGAGASWSAGFAVTPTGTGDVSALGVEVTWSSAGTAFRTQAWTPYSLPPTVGNLALNKPASQASTAYDGVAARAVDGNTDGRWGSGSVTHSEESITEPWWQVDLGSTTAVGSVELFNRTDCCSDRLTDPVILLSDAPLPADLDDALATPGVTVHQVSGAVGESTKVRLSGAAGRYLRVQLPGTGRTLSLAEVVVRAP